MSLPLLFWDELRGFIKSKVMLALWIGLPLLTIIMHFIQPDAEGLPVTVLTGLLTASLGGLLAAVILSTTIVNEMNASVYDLFLIRPVKRGNILLAKYFAVFFSLVIASFLSFTIGVFIDWLSIGLPPTEVLLDALDALVMSISAMSIACVMGILIGILVKSVALAAILAFYLGEQLSVAVLIPGIYFESLNPLYFSLGVGTAITIVIMIVTLLLFRKKQF